MSESQTDKILFRLQTVGTITPAEAYNAFGCLALHSRAAELCERGYDVVCTIKTGNGKRWGCYSLRGQSELAL